MKRSFFYLFGFALFFLISTSLQAQLSAPGADGSDRTNYTSFPEIDSIYIFCTTNEIDEVGVLRMTTGLTGTKTFLWEKYNSNSAAFEFYFSESTDASYSEISGLADGGYRITITQGATTELKRAWVFNNWTKVTSSVAESNCEFFKLTGEFTTAELNYYDLADNTELQVAKNVRVQWKNGDDIISALITTVVYDPPTKDTEYTLRVYDKFECEGISRVTYESIVTKAKFKVDFGEQDPAELEAPLTVSFINESENGDPTLYEWFLFRDLNEIKKESEESDEPIDSIMIVAYGDNPPPVYIYERTGIYNVKLVSKHVSENYTCVDTVYIDEYIKIDSSYIKVPNVFTPNGDGINDEFVVKFFSMQSVQITLLNRWGRKVHYWESENVRGFEGTWAETVWDGKLMGGRYASPGVYYYNIVGEGRDGTRRRAHGFFHLFREK
jgi:gliding motility-associated-like protein